MKKLLSVTLVLLLAVCCMLTMVSCFGGGEKPELDLEKAAEALEDRDYTVEYTDDDLEIPALEEQLRASKSTDGDHEYIYILRFKDTKSAKLYYENIKLGRESQQKSSELEIEFYEHLLKKYEDDMKSDEIDEYEDELKEMKKALENSQEDYTYGRSGKIVWYGTTKAAKHTKD